MSKLNILNLATFDEGGAGIASRNFNDLFIRSGHNSILLVKESNQTNKNVFVLNKLTKEKRFKTFYRKVLKRVERYLINSKVGKLDEKYTFLNVFEEKQNITSNRILDNITFKPDIIVLHWISKFINSKTIKELQEQTQAKVFWIMMDNAPLTGGCHYPWDCNGYTTDCLNCPAILNPQKKSVAFKNLACKKKYLPTNLELITCSEQDYKRALQSSVFKTKKIHKILFPLDENKFKPVNRKEAKTYWGIDVNTKVLFYGSISLIDKRKGSSIFLMALKELQYKYEKERVDCNNIIILIAGNNELDVFKDLKFQFKMVGYLNEDELIRAYQAADFFVSSSLEDSGPLMVNQSIMCGTPVVSFNIGVANDLVKTGETGYIAGHGKFEELANGIKYILELNEKEYIKMTSKCRKLALDKYSNEKTINNWNELFY